MLGAFVMLDKAYGSQQMQVTVARLVRRERAQSGWAWSQHSTKQTMPITHVLMMMILHTPVHSSGTVTTHAHKHCIQENDAGLVNMCLMRAQRLVFWEF
jgi:hypothetical protein